MTPKQTALFTVAKLIATAVLTGFVAGILLNTFTLEQVGLGFSILLLAFLVNLVYRIELDKAETLAKLNEVSKK